MAKSVVNASCVYEIRPTIYISHGLISDSWRLVIQDDRRKNYVADLVAIDLTETRAKEIAEQLRIKIYVY